MKTALVLGGGGARGLAHIGVLKAFEKANIEIDLIVGCSFGAVIGGVYAQHPCADELKSSVLEFVGTKAFESLGLKLLQKNSKPTEDFLQQFTRNVRDWVVLNISAKRTALLKSQRLESALGKFLKPQTFAENKIRFACNATDLVTGRPHVFTDGDMRQAIIASATIPGYFPPVKIDGKQLVDGAVTHNLPVQIARDLGAETVYAVDVHPHLAPETQFSSVIDVILRTKTITSNTLSEEVSRQADILIRPPVREYFWYEFDRCKELIQAGEEAADQVLRKLKPRKLVRRKRAIENTQIGQAS